MICDASIHDFGLIKSDKALSGIVKEMYLRVHIWGLHKSYYIPLLHLCVPHLLFLWPLRFGLEDCAVPESVHVVFDEYYTISRVKQYWTATNRSVSTCCVFGWT